MAKKNIFYELKIDDVEALAKFTSLNADMYAKGLENASGLSKELAIKMSQMSELEQANIRKMLHAKLDSHVKELDSLKKFVEDSFQKEMKAAKDLDEVKRDLMKKRHKDTLDAIEEEKKKAQEALGTAEKKGIDWNKDITAPQGLQKAFDGLGAFTKEITGAIFAGIALTEAMTGISLHVLEAIQFYPAVTKGRGELSKTTMEMSGITWAGGTPGSDLSGAATKAAFGELTSTMLGLNAAFDISSQEFLKSLDNLRVKGLIGIADSPKLMNDAFMLGLSRHMTMEQVTGFMGELAHKFEVPISNLSNVFAELSRPAIDEHSKKVVMAGSDILKNTMDLSKGLRNLGFDLGDTNAVVNRFAKELAEGKLSLSDLSTMMKGMTEQPIGTQVFMAQQIMGMSESEAEGMGAGGMWKLMQRAKGKTATEQAAIMEYVSAARETGDTANLSGLLNRMGISAEGINLLSASREMGQGRFIQGMAGRLGPGSDEYVKMLYENLLMGEGGGTAAARVGRHAGLRAQTLGMGVTTTAEESVKTQREMMSAADVMYGLMNQDIQRKADINVRLMPKLRAQKVLEDAGFMSGTGITGTMGEKFDRYGLPTQAPANVFDYWAKASVANAKVVAEAAASQGAVSDIGDLFKSVPALKGLADLFSGKENESIAIKTKAVKIELAQAKKEGRKPDVRGTLEIPKPRG